MVSKNIKECFVRSIFASILHIVTAFERLFPDLSTTSGDCTNWNLLADRHHTVTEIFAPCRSDHISLGCLRKPHLKPYFRFQFRQRKQRKCHRRNHFICSILIFHFFPIFRFYSSSQCILRHLLRLFYCHVLVTLSILFYRFYFVNSCCSSEFFYF